MENNFEPWPDKAYYDMRGVHCDEEYTFFYDETNNCRKFWVREESNSFNADYDADFVLAGVCFDKKVPELKLDELVDLLGLQSNTKEIKFNKHFSEREFLDCMNKKRMRTFLRWLDSKEHVYIHYLNVNNLYYTIVEILDSITTPDEIYEFGFDYFDMKSELYNVLKRNPQRLQEIMVRYKYPNIITEDIADFCDEMISLFPNIYDQSVKQKYLAGCFRRSKHQGKLVFLEDNENYVMQENYVEFYIDPIMTYKKSKHYFDEEKSIKENFGDYTFLGLEKEVKNYEFVDSKNMLWVQVSDVIAGIFGKLFAYVNKKTETELIKEIDNYSECQLECIYLIDKLRNKANEKDKGLLHSLTSIKTVVRLDNYLSVVKSIKMKKI